jgi:hypothetical protein
VHKQEEQPRNRRADVSVQGHAVRPRHAHSRKIESAHRGETEQQQSPASGKASQAPILGQEYDKESRDYDSQRRMQEAVHDVKQRGVSESGDIGAVGNEQKSEDQQELAQTSFDVDRHEGTCEWKSDPIPGGREQVYASKRLVQAAIFILIGRFFSIIRNGISAPGIGSHACPERSERGTVFVPWDFDWGQECTNPRHERHAVATGLQ